MAAIEFNLQAFYAAFPAFQQKPVDSLQQYWNVALSYVDNQIYGCTNVANQTQYLNLMTAHLVALSDLIIAGETPGMVTGAGIDKVNVTLQPPPEKNQFQWWLNLTSTACSFWRFCRSIPSAGSMSAAAPNSARSERSAGASSMATVTRTPGPDKKSLQILTKGLQGKQGRVGWFQSAHYENGTPSLMSPRFRNSEARRIDPAPFVHAIDDPRKTADMEHLDRRRR